MIMQTLTWDVDAAAVAGNSDAYSLALATQGETKTDTYMGQNFERCTIGNFQTLSTSITPGSPPVTQKPFLLVSS